MHCVLDALRMDTIMAIFTLHTSLGVCMYSVLLIHIYSVWYDYFSFSIVYLTKGLSPFVSLLSNSYDIVSYHIISSQGHLYTWKTNWNQATAAPLSWQAPQFPCLDEFPGLVVLLTLYSYRNWLRRNSMAEVFDVLSSLIPEIIYLITSTISTHICLYFLEKMFLCKKSLQQHVVWAWLRNKEVVMSEPTRPALHLWMWGKLV